MCVCVCVGGGWGVLVSDGNGDGGRCLEWEFGIGKGIWSQIIFVFNHVDPCAQTLFGIKWKKKKKEEDDH